MEELATRAPEAHQYLSQMPPEIQEDIAGRLSDLGHESTIQTDMFGRAEHISVEDYTPEQIEHGERIGSMMGEAARLTQKAHTELTQHGEIETVGYETPADRVFGRAKDLALQEAIEAKENNDPEASVAAIQNAMVLELLHPQDYGDDTRDVRFGSLIAVGMADELLGAAHDMHGVVSVGGRSQGYAQSASELFTPFADTIRVAANADFDDQFQHVEVLVEPGQPAEGIQKRNEIIERLNYQGLITLAKEAADVRKNSQLASVYTEKALEELAKNAERIEHTDSKKVADLLVAADQLLKEEEREVLADTLRALKTMRTAGLKPYRTNIPATGALDKTLISLVANGEHALASELLSVSPHEVTDQADQRYSSTNIGVALMMAVSAGEFDEANTQGVISEVLEMQEKKLAEFMQQLHDAGAPADTIEKILRNSPNPDLALDVPAEFWQQYAEAIQRSEGESVQHRIRATNMQNLIEGGEEYNVAMVAQNLMKLIEQDVPANLYTREMMRILSVGIEGDEQEAYIQQLASVGNQIINDETLSPHEQTQTLNALYIFKQPEQALKITQEVYGNGSPGSLGRIAKFSQDGMRSYAELLIIPEEVKTVLENETFRELLSKTDLTTDVRDTIAETIFRSSEPLLTAEEISDILTTGEFAELIGDNGAGYGLRSALIKSVLESADMTEAAKALTGTFGGGNSLWYTTSQLAELSVGSSFYCDGARVSRIPSSLPIRSTTSYDRQSITYLEGEEMVRHLSEVYGVEVEGSLSGGVEISALPEDLQTTILTAHLYEAITMSREPSLREQATQRNTGVSAENIFESNNLHHFTGYGSLPAILQNGLLPGEFIASQMRADSFPFNVDLVESTSEVLLKPTHQERLDSLASRGFGDMALHIRRSGDSSEFRPGEEYPATEIGYGGQHRLIPGGFPATEISAVTLKTPDALASAKTALLEAGVFIPVFDSSGEILYSYEQYVQDRRDGNYDVVVPEIVDSTFERPNSQGGSNEGAEFIVPSSIRGEAPQRFYCKFAKPDNTEHLWSELLADELYRSVTPELVPDTKPVILEGRLARASTMVEIDEDQPVTDEARNAGFIMDALLGNWDATYNSANLVMSRGNAMRIDTGNALFFRARGDRKSPQQFSTVVAELEEGTDNSELGAGMRQNYPGLTEDDITRQVGALEESLTDERIDQAVDSVRMSDGERQELKRILKARRDYIISWAARS